MTRRSNYILVGILFLASALSGCQKEAFDKPEEKKAEENSAPFATSDMVPGEAIIKLSPGYAGNPTSLRTSLRSALRSVSDEVELEPVFEIGGPYETLQKKYGLHLWMKVKFDQDANLNEALSNLQKNSAIDHVEGNVRVHQTDATYSFAVGVQPMSVAPTSGYNNGYPKFNKADPYLKYQWHYQNDGNSSEPFVRKGADINLFNAWDNETGKKNVIVAIIDSGVDFNHPDLQDSKWSDPQNPSVHGKNCTNGTTDITAGFHGTHVAGTIAARSNNGIGVAGIAGGNGTPDSGVRLMSIQIFNADAPGVVIGAGGGAKSQQIADGFKWAVEHGATIANCSWGFLAGQPGGHQEVLETAIKYFVDNAGIDPLTLKQRPDAPMKGGAVFFASGNDKAEGKKVYPACYESVIAVASFGPNMERAFYANIDNWVDIMAPGGLTDSFEHFGILSTVTTTFGQMYEDPEKRSLANHLYYQGTNNYAYMQGTSMATPHVTGVAALMVSKFGQHPGFTNTELRSRILGAVKRIDHVTINKKAKYSSWLGSGYVDAAIALEENTKVAPVMKAIENKEINFSDATIAWEVAEDTDAANKMALEYNITLKGGATDVNTQIINYEHVLGQTLTQKFEKLTDNTEYTVIIEAKDRWGNASKKEGKFKTKLNHAPSIKMPDQPYIINKSESFVNLTLDVTDEENHTWTLENVKMIDGVEITQTQDRKGVHFLFTPGMISEGDYNVTFTLRDEEGKEANVNFAYKSIKYKAPIKLAEFGDMSFAPNENVPEIDLKSKFSSPASLPLTYTAKSSNELSIGATIKDGKLVLTPKSVGTSTITITASDGKNSVNQIFTVNVKSAQSGKADDGMYVVYPIPTNDNLNILTKSSVSSLNVALTSVRGEVVMRKTLTVDSASSIATAQLGNIVPGVYKLAITNGNSTVIRTIIKK